MNHRSWAISWAGGTKIGFWLIWVFLFLYNWSEVYHLHYILIEKNRTWRATKQLQIKLYLIKLWSLSWNSISRSLCEIWKSIIWSPMEFICHFLFSCNKKLLHHLSQKPTRSSSKNEIRRVMSKRVFRPEKNCFFNARWCVGFWWNYLLSVVLGFCLRSTTSEM